MCKLPSSWPPAWGTQGRFRTACCVFAGIGGIGAEFREAHFYSEKFKANFSSENLNISFNSKYLIDIASEVEDKSLKMNFKDSVSPVLIEDLSDKNSYYVIMPMKI